MKRAHRRAHLLLWLVVGPAAVFVLWRALAARPPVPVQATTGATEAPARAAQRGAADAEADR